MRVITLASGSRGNSLLVESACSRILVDVGISCRKLSGKLEELDISPGTIDAILVTHEHQDHVSGLRPVVRKYGLPYFLSLKTLEALVPRVGVVGGSNIVESGVEFHIKDVTVHPFSMSHDAADPLSFTFQSSVSKVTVATDLGVAGHLVRERLRHSDLVVIEANHDEDMLKEGPYPWPLKQRIMGNRGHLSNVKCGELLSEIMHPDLKGIILAHISEENNTPELAFDTVAGRLCEDNPSFDLSILNAPSQNEICTISL